jgi:DNA-binding transcriptional regulator YhcF (GntR family)
MIDHIFDEKQPIYLQIVQRIHSKILRGDYQPGEKLPSVIEAAMVYKVNHNTIARAYTELIRSGVAEVRRGEGTFVTQDEKMLQKLKVSLRDSVIRSFLNEMKAMGNSFEEVLDLLQQAAVSSSPPVFEEENNKDESELHGRT